jgi:glutamate dehydrogenase
MMLMTEDHQKIELIDRVADRAGELAEPGRDEEARTFVRQFYEHVPPDGVLDDDPDNLVRAALSVLELGRERTPGTPKIRIYTPRREEGGWSSPYTILEVVNDDMRFLVDSVASELHRLGIELCLVIHPIVTVERDAAGRLTAVHAHGEAAGGGLRESFMQLRIAPQPNERYEEIRAGVAAVLTDVRRVIEDWRDMRDRCRQIAEELERNPPPLPPGEVAEGTAFLRWLASKNFTFLGYREYSFEGGEGADAVARVLPESGLGLLREEPFVVFDGLRNLGKLPEDIRDFLRQPVLLRITKSNRLSTVHKPVPMDTVAVKCFDPEGRVTGERLFIGLFTAAAYASSPQTIPLLLEKIQETLDRAGFAADSYDGKNLRHIIETYPRDELFQISRDDLYRNAMGILYLQERQRTALFVRHDPFRRFVACLVFVPRDRYDTDLRLRIETILAKAFDGEAKTAHTQVTDSVLARLYIIVSRPSGRVRDADVEEVAARIAEAARSWSDRLEEALGEVPGEERRLQLLQRYERAFPAGYQARFAGAAAVFDILQLEEAFATDGLTQNLYRPSGRGPHELSLKIYGSVEPRPLSDILPMLENMGVKVVAEMPFDVALDGVGSPVWVRELRMVSEDGMAIDLDAVREAFHETFECVWRGEIENDGFNKLVLRAGLVARQVLILRAYCKYLRQAQIPFSQTYMEQTLARNPRIARALVDLFLERFDPRRAGAGSAELRAGIDTLLEGVQNLDEDRILRRFLNLIEATLRTNYFQSQPDGHHKPYFSFKLNSRAIEELPLPRPFREVFVYSPRVEAIHLRGGKVARGGIRWSDRREDFRTEVLDLMKTQMVKNAVIVPVGSKGGFVVKQPPAGGGREALQQEGIECYKTLMRGLLDLTDNLKGREVVPPPDVVRYDDNDPYLVVAADKGTATFSDIANGISADYGFWLDDAFASGGSAGYDHKEMAITSRGAWEGIKRHFRELGKNIQEEDFTAVGVGDMSGDVFGNGMLRSHHTRLLAAFDHRHIFLDPDPDPERSFEERLRLFSLPRSSWADYDPALISPGGGVFERGARTIPVTPQVASVLGLSTEQITPNALIQAILRAPVDLLFFGGIGTFVKASIESHADAKDRTSDPLRVDARELRARVIGEGANLAMTQRARIEYAFHGGPEGNGGRLNTDFIDNSAGVDCSDHEVNIKILLNEVERQGSLTREARNRLLEEMTDEVAALVLRDNYLQTQAITVTYQLGYRLLDRLGRYLRELERAGRIDRRIEFLPDDEALADRARLHLGLTRPEIAVLLAYAKITLYEEILGSELPDDPFLQGDLQLYFPAPLRERFAEAIGHHRLRREIIATAVTNSVINRTGPALVHEVRERTGEGAPEIARAYVIAREIFQLRKLWAEIESLDNQVPAPSQAAMLTEGGRLIDRAATWFLRNGDHPLDIGSQIAAFAPGVQELADHLDELLTSSGRAQLAAKMAQFPGVPEPLALRVAALASWLAPALDIVRIARSRNATPLACARFYFSLGDRFGFDRLREVAARLSTDKAVDKQAVSAITDDLWSLQAELTARVMASLDGSVSVDQAIAAWSERRRPVVARAEQVLAELRTAEAPSLALLVVANRALKAMAG